MKTNFFLILFIVFTCQASAQNKTFSFTDEEPQAGAVKPFDQIYYCTKCGKVDHQHCYTEFDIYCGDLSSASSKSIDSLIAFLLLHPEIAIEISHHTDVRGSFNYTMKLSNYRLISLVTRLNQSGINPAQVSYMAYGNSNPLMTEKEIKKLPENEQEKAHAKNQRTEIRIRSVDGNFNEQYISPKLLDSEKTMEVFSDADSVIELSDFNFVFFEEKVNAVMKYDKDSALTKLSDFTTHPRKYAAAWRKESMWLWIKIIDSGYEQAINLSAIKKPFADVDIHELKPHIEFDFR